MASVQDRINEARRSLSAPSTNTSAPAATSVSARIQRAKQTLSEAAPIEEDNRSFGEKLSDFFGYAAEKTVSGINEGVEGVVNAGSYAQQLLQKSAMQQAAGGAALAAEYTDNPYVAKAAERQHEDAQKSLTDPMKTVANFGDRYAQKVEEKYADKPLSKATRLVGDVAQGVGGLVPSVAANLILPGSGLAVMTTGSIGNATQEAKNAGADDAHALAYGVAVGAIEAATEKLLGGMGGLFGKGALDDVAKNAIRTRVSSPAVAAGMTTLVSALGEGTEEFLSEFATALANKGLIKTDARTGKEILSDAGYSALIGGIIGGLANAGDSIEAGRSVTPKQAALEAAENAAKSIESSTDSEAVFSPSERLSSEPTTDASAEQNAIRDMPGNATGATTTLPTGTGAAEAGFNTTVGEQVPTQDKTTTESGYYTEEEKQRFAPGTHERISEEESVNRAQRNFYVDSDGNIVNLDATVEDLLAKDAWTGVDQDTAQIAMMELVRRARKTGDYSVADAFSKRMQETGASEAGRSLQARKKWISQGGANIISEAMAATEGMDVAERSEVLGVVIDLAQEYDNAVRGEVSDNAPKRGADAFDMTDDAPTVLDAKREVDGLMELIRRTAKIRHTAGMFTDELSKSAEWALNRVADIGDIEFLRKLAANGIYNIAADKQSASVGEKIKTVRRNAMLSKISTVMRNLVSNGVFDITDSISRNISVPLDAYLSQFTGTRSVAVDKSWFSEAKRKGTADGLARSLLEVGLDIDTTGDVGRYESTANRTFNMSGGVMGQLMSTWEKWSGYALQSTDAAMKGGTAAEIQRGIDELYNKGLIKDGEKANPQDGAPTFRKVKPGMVDAPYDAQKFYTDGYAQRGSLDDAGQTEALYRTFQDDSKLAGMTLDFRKGLNRIGVNGFGLGDVVLPFAKTPANLASRALEYSPAGLIKGAADLAEVMVKAKNGTLTAAEQARAVQEIGRGLNGTALIGIAAALAASGIIKTLGNGKDDEDAKATALSKSAGENGTQINLDAAGRWLSGQGAEWKDGDTLVSISFLEPLNAQLTTGALIAEDIQSEDATAWEKIALAAKRTPEGAIKAVMDMPVMSAFKDIADAYKYSEGETQGEKVADAAKNYAASQVSSFIPNAVKGIAQGTDPYQRNTYTADNVWGEMWDSVRASIPGLRQTLPTKLDSFGQPMETEGGVQGFLNSNVLPGYVTTYETPTAYDMLMELYDKSGDTKILPEKSAPNSVTVDSVKHPLNEQQKTKWMQAAGGKHEDLLAAAETNEAFGALDDDGKLEVLNKLRLAAADAGKEAAGVPAKQSATEKAIAALGAGDMVTYYAYWNDMDVPEHYTGNPNWQKFQTIVDMGFDDGATLGLIESVEEKVGKKFREAHDLGVPLSDVAAYYRAKNERLPDGRDKNASEALNATMAVQYSNPNSFLILDSIF